VRDTEVVRRYRKAVGGIALVMDKEVWLVARKVVDEGEARILVVGMERVNGRGNSWVEEGTEVVVDDLLEECNLVDLDIGFAGNVDIQIPLSDLVSELSDGTCASFISIGSDDFSHPTGGPAKFGDAFILSVYATFDIDALEITLSQVRITDEERIVLF